MNYFKVSMYPDGKVTKEQVTKEEARGYIGAGIYYHGAKDTYYDFFIDEEDKIQKIYDKYIKRKIRECNDEIKRLRNTIVLLDKANTLI